MNICSMGLVFPSSASKTHNFYWNVSILLSKWSFPAKGNVIEVTDSQSLLVLHEFTSKQWRLLLHKSRQKQSEVSFLFISHCAKLKLHQIKHEAKTTSSSDRFIRTKLIGSLSIQSDVVLHQCVFIRASVCITLTVIQSDPYWTLFLRWWSSAAWETIATDLVWSLIYCTRCKTWERSLTSAGLNCVLTCKTEPKNYK